VTQGSLKQSVFRLLLETVCPENCIFNFLKSFCGQFNKNDDELTLSQIGRLIFYRFYCFPQQELINKLTLESIMPVTVKGKISSKTNRRNNR